MVALKSLNVQRTHEWLDADIMVGSIRSSVGLNICADLNMTAQSLKYLNTFPRSLRNDPSCPEPLRGEVGARLWGESKSPVKSVR